MFEFNDALARQSIDPECVLIMRHRPPEAELRRQLPWLATERHAVFNAYQAFQPRAERAMQRATYLASFIGQGAGRATFVGLYRITGQRQLAPGEIDDIAEYRVLAGLGVEPSTEEVQAGHHYFELSMSEHFADWSGRLICKWPPPDRSWYRWASRNVLEIEALCETSRFEQRMPSWDELVMTRADLEAMPRAWQAALAQWRGIYFITDETDGKGYVGSAYGGDNIMGRWRAYASNGHGGNVELRDRAGHPLRFSILQRVSPDMDPADVIALETSWKQRLHTRDLGLNRN
ncbi:MAG: GIY-YIG nuclease family protein [Alphaproteobacteria bacterium]|nr:GIY-YIG nuclease family protein [Alphaproteobacteria bacterium]